MSIDSTGWQTVELPTRYFRHSGSAYLPWKKPRRFAFRFRNAGRIELDGIELVDAPSILIPPRSLLRNFPAWLSGKGRIHRSGSFAILTDEPSQARKTFAELDRMLNMFLADFPGAKLPAQPSPCSSFPRSPVIGFLGRLVGEIQLPRTGSPEWRLCHAGNRRFLL